MPMKPYLFGSTISAYSPSTQTPRAQAVPTPAPIQNPAVIKIIDWAAVAWATLDFSVCVVAGVGEIGSQLGLSAILLPGAVLAFVVLMQKLAGTVFDLDRGTIRFYSWWLPRTLALTDIRDANCQFAITLSPSHIALAICGGGKDTTRGRSGNGQRTYSVNLSGNFGSRQVRFFAERWRDTFLSILRDQAPACRITRWF